MLQRINGEWILPQKTWRLLWLWVPVRRIIGKRRGAMPDGSKLITLIDRFNEPLKQAGILKKPISSNRERPRDANRAPRPGTPRGSQPPAYRDALEKPGNRFWKLSFFPNRNDEGYRHHA